MLVNAVHKCQNGIMEGHVDIYMHDHEGKWMREPLLYVRGSVHIVEEFDIESLDILTILNVYNQQLKYVNLQYLYVLKPDMSKRFM